MKKAILIYSPTPIFGGQIGANKQDGFSALFGLGNNKKLVQKVQAEIKAHHLEWQFEFDETESDAEAISQQNVTLAVLLPGLEKKFDKNGLQNDFIQLTSGEYQQNDVTRIIAYMKQPH